MKSFKYVLRFSHILHQFNHIICVGIFPVNQLLRIFPSSNAKHVLIDTLCFAFVFFTISMFVLMFIFFCYDAMSALYWFSFLCLQPLQDLRSKVRDDDVSPSPPHATQHLHKSHLQIKRSCFGSMIQHGVLSRHLINSQWVCWIL